MKVADITAYFAKKIAKPILIDIAYREDHLFYAIEATAVEEDTVHMLVTMNYEMWFGDKVKRDEYLGEVAVPVRDGDTVQSVLDAAIAIAHFGSDSVSAEVRGYDNHQIRAAYAKYVERREDRQSGPRI